MSSTGGQLGIEGLASIDSEGTRKNYAYQFAKHLRLDAVEAARLAFEKIIEKIK